MHRRWNHKLKRYEDSVVYNKETGEAVPCYPIDGRELIASGDYCAEMPELQGEQEAGEAPPAAEPVPSHPPKRRGRPRKTD